MVVGHVHAMLHKQNNRFPFAYKALVVNQMDILLTQRSHLLHCTVLTVLVCLMKRLFSSIQSIFFYLIPYFMFLLQILTESIAFTLFLVVLGEQV